MPLSQGVSYWAVPFCLLFLGLGAISVMRPTRVFDWMRAYYQRVPRWLALLTGSTMFEFLPRSGHVVGIVMMGVVLLCIGGLIALLIVGQAETATSIFLGVVERALEQR